MTNPQIIARTGFAKGSRHGIKKTGRESAETLNPSPCINAETERQHMNTDRPKPPSNQAHDAFEVHCTLLYAELRCPSLRMNPHWTVLRMEAYADYALALEAE